MKLNGISVGNDHPKDNRTLEQFIGSEQATTPLGKLLIALTEETVWSNEYTVYASFELDEPFVQVNHKTFLPSGSLMVHDDGKTVLSVRGVEDAIRTHIKDSQEKLRPSIDILQGQINDLSRASDQITANKAKAAITAAFPEAVFQYTHPDSKHHGLHFAMPNDRDGPTFVAREIDHEFVGGVARINVTSFQWYSMEGGVGPNQKLGIFWAALARAFAANELKVPEENLRPIQMSAAEKPWEPSMIDPYDVKKTVLRCPTLEYPTPEVGTVETDIIVEFGPDNLPAKMTLVPVVPVKRSNHPLRHSSQISDT